MISCTVPPPVFGWRRACASADGWNRPRCPDRRRSASGASRPDRVSRSSSRSSVAASSHCRSSRKSASGCSGRANTPIKRRNTNWKRPCACLGRKLGDRRLVADDELQFGNEVDHEPPVRAERLQKRVAPGRQFGFALAEKGPDEALKGLRERRIGDVALVLVELAGCKQPARRNERLVQLIDDGGFADAGISGDQHQLRRARS